MKKKRGVEEIVSVRTWKNVHVFTALILRAQPVMSGLVEGHMRCSKELVFLHAFTVSTAPQLLHKQLAANTNSIVIILDRSSAQLTLVSVNDLFKYGQHTRALPHI